MSNFVKLYGSILTSSIWLESDATLRVFITMLAMADADGVVEASVGGLAHVSRVSRENCVEALGILSSPDDDSRTGDNEGRRIEKIDGGWRLLNSRKYRDMRSPKQIYNADRQRKLRGGDNIDNIDNMSQMSHGVATEVEVEVEVEAEVEVETTTKATTTDLSDSVELFPEHTKPTGTFTATTLTGKADVKLVLDRYKELHPRRTIDGPKPRAIVERALKSGRTADELIEAIEGNAADPWHVAITKHELSYILRDDEHIDRAIALRHAPPPPMSRYQAKQAEREELGKKLEAKYGPLPTLVRGTVPRKAS